MGKLAVSSLMWEFPIQFELFCWSAVWNWSFGLYIMIFMKKQIDSLSENITSQLLLIPGDVILCSLKKPQKNILDNYIATHRRSGLDHPFKCHSSFIKMTLYSEPIHQGIIDLLAAAMLHLSIKLSCQITWRLWIFSLYIKTSLWPWSGPYLLAGKSLRSWHHEAEGLHHTLTAAPSLITIPFPLTISPSVGITSLITLHILYRNPPERHGSLSPWLS